MNLFIFHAKWNNEQKKKKSSLNGANAFCLTYTVLCWMKSYIVINCGVDVCSIPYALSSLSYPHKHIQRACTRTNGKKAMWNYYNLVESHVCGRNTLSQVQKAMIHNFFYRRNTMANVKSSPSFTAPTQFNRLRTVITAQQTEYAALENKRQQVRNAFLIASTDRQTHRRSIDTHNTSSTFLTSGISSRRERDREQDNTKLTKNRKQLRPVVCSTDTYQNGCVWNGLNHNNQKQQQTNKRTNGVKKKIIERGRQEEYHPIGISLECAPLEIEHHWNTHRNHGNTSVSVCYRLPTQRNSSNDAAEWWMMLTTAAIQHQQQHKKKEEIFRTEHQQQRGYYCVIKNQI